MLHLKCSMHWRFIYCIQRRTSAPPAVSRILCASDVINKHIPEGFVGSHQHAHASNKIQRWCRSSPLNTIDEAPMHTAFEMKHVIDSLVADLTQSQCDEGHFLPLYPNMPYLRNDQFLGTRRAKAHLSSQIIDSNTPPCKVIPLSQLYAPRDALLTQAMGKEFFFCSRSTFVSHNGQPGYPTKL